MEIRFRIYHCSPDRLKIGQELDSADPERDSIRKLVEADPSILDGEAQIFRKVELLFEECRVQLCPDHPSRLDSIFACWQKEHLSKWIPHRPHKYELEMVSVTKMMTADALWFNLMVNRLKRGQIELEDWQIRHMASLYWSGLRGEDVEVIGKERLNSHYELLLQGKLKVVRELEGV